MAPEGLKLFFRAGMFITLLALLLVITVPRASAEYVASICSLAIGIALLAGVALVSRVTRK